MFSNDHLGNFAIALCAFFMWLSTIIQNHYVGVMGAVVLLFTALNQYRGWRNRLLDKRRLELEIKRLEKMN